MACRGFSHGLAELKMRTAAKNILSQALGFHHVMLEALNNVLTVQAYTMEPFERERFRDSTTKMMNIGLRHSFYRRLVNPITEVLGIGMSQLQLPSSVVSYQSGNPDFWVYHDKSTNDCSGDYGLFRNAYWCFRSCPKTLESLRG